MTDNKSAPIVAGDAVEPGSLLRPGDGTVNQSITVLLPDGQRLLFECFTQEDCARGFRVPSLYRRPDAFAVDMLARIRAALADGDHDRSAGSSIEQASRLPRDEVMAILGPNNMVEIGGLVKNLPNGRYTYDLRPLDRTYQRQYHLVMNKTAPSITVQLPSSGLYVLTITDDLNKPRLDLFIAAVTPAQAEGFEKSFGKAKALLKDWNENYQGWPIHDFQRAYLESLVPGAASLTTGRKTGQARKLVTASGPSRPGLSRGLGEAGRELDGLTAEPSFFPKPGLFEKDTLVTLGCHTPGATMHFTVDGSQPVAGSPIYRAPITVKGTELTIKSFASLPGKKDSAVVTGIFRIQE